MAILTTNDDDFEPCLSACVPHLVFGAETTSDVGADAKAFRVNSKGLSSADGRVCDGKVAVATRRHAAQCWITRARR